LKRFYATIPEKNLLPGKGINIKIKKRKIALFKHLGKVYAIQHNCPHQNAELIDGYIKDKKIFCALHHWSFDLDTGAYSLNPKMALNTFDVRITDGIIHIGLHER
jgi:nitrite reductase/ring-hydroxylating ferredoxin subunit